MPPPLKDQMHVLAVVPKQKPMVTSCIAKQINSPTPPHPHRLQRWARLNHILARNEEEVRTNEKACNLFRIELLLVQFSTSFASSVSNVFIRVSEVLLKELRWIMKSLGCTLVDFRDKHEVKHIHVIVSIR